MKDVFALILKGLDLYRTSASSIDLSTLFLRSSATCLYFEFV